MPPKATDSDFEAIENTLLLLRYAGCPDVRRGQGAPEFLARMHPGQRTPDIVAGPLEGFGSPNDFYIDVQSPSGDYFLKDEVGAPIARGLYERALQTGVFQFPELGADHFKRVLIDPLERKMGKYGRERESALYGHVLYFGVSDGPPHMGITALDYLCAAVAMIAEAQGQDSARAAMAHVEAGGVIGRVLAWPLRPLAFIGFVFLWDASKLSLLLLVNFAALGRHQDHPVVEWLRRSFPVSPR